MILVDSSVWIDHFRSGLPELAHTLERGEVLMHSFVLGELACGNLRQRSEILALLGELPLVHEATHHEVMHMIEEHKLMGRGIGYVDAHLLAAVALTPGAALWTRDMRLATLTITLGLARSSIG